MANETTTNPESTLTRMATKDEAVHRSARGSDERSLSITGGYIGASIEEGTARIWPEDKGVGNKVGGPLRFSLVKASLRRF
jgi:hypothetical protein